MILPFHRLNRRGWDRFRWITLRNEVESQRWLRCTLQDFQWSPYGYLSQSGYSHGSRMASGDSSSFIERGVWMLSFVRVFQPSPGLLEEASTRLWSEPTALAVIYFPFKTVLWVLITVVTIAHCCRFHFARMSILLGMWEFGCRDSR